MSRKASIGAILAVVLAAFSGGWGASGTSASAQGQNLLKNPEFGWPAQTNGDLCAPGWQKDNAITPHDWTPYWTCKNLNERNQDQINRPPEFRVMTVDIAKDRVHGGDTSASFFTFWALNRSMGLYQRVPGITPGTRLRFSVWVNLLTTDSDELPLSSTRAPGGLQARACIHTSSGFALTPNFSDPAMVCGPWARYYDTWGELSVEATAAYNEVAVVIDTTADYPVKHNDVHVDDAALVVAGVGAAPAAAPAAAAAPQAQTQAQAPVAANDGTPQVTVSVDGANVRAAPSTSAQVLARAQVGVALPLRAYTSDKQWFQVTYAAGPNGVAYLHSSVVTLNAAAQAALNGSAPAAQPAAAAPQPTAQPQSPSAAVAAPAAPANAAAAVLVNTGGSRLNVRSAPNSTATIIAKAANGAALTVTGVSPDKLWWKVTIAGAPDNTGWVMAQFVTPNAAAQKLMG